MNDEESAALGRLIRDGAELIESRTEAEHVYCFRINDKTPHLHFHLIPRYPDTPKEYWGTNIMACTTSPKLASLEEIRATVQSLISV